MENKKACCGGNRNSITISNDINMNPNTRNHVETVQKPNSTSSQMLTHHVESFVPLEGGTFWMGSNSDEGFPNDGEGPMREIFIDSFEISKYTVTNIQFADFVTHTGYVTEAEKFNWSYVYTDFVSKNNLIHKIASPPKLPWWSAIKGAYWACPEGEGSTWVGRENHPVVHISWNDATAYCKWIGGRLPTEAEWEYAARGGLEGKRYPWGNELQPNKQHMCNIWQGKFPIKNHASDGYLGTAPVEAFEPNGYGLYQMSGNVWEWCQDYFDRNYHQSSNSTNPLWTKDTGLRSIRGGSYMCHRDYCNRYRVAARSSNTPDTSIGHCGFRVVRDRK
ncbi:MAG: formylglycine-generating enzyme family protein [Candidatus Pristimantibacillus lignocellulolyticus]|uniref:Formylglycine-generating enzyme family protein n=1 Tax=Candidatus Pristimantibacillus lignocellulolyticus TaxID=2994561 RepID=A0A9J6ZEC9_9BACL|nr:MAG: formylglycine-generating enzyme family protein [Candidatus Pristimantibacillus lignocellulolyticus]